MAFNLTGASAPTNDAVDLTFDQTLGTGSVTIDPASYSFTGALVATGVLVLTSTSLRVYTTPQHAGITYTVTVVGAVVDGTNTALTGKQATFAGTATPIPFVVSGLSARTDCRGKAVYLTWTTPDDGAGSAHIQVHRRLKAWPFAAGDPADLLLDAFLPMGEHTMLDTGLLPQTFYYYLVVAADPVTGAFAATNASRTWGLSIDTLDSKDHFWEWAPATDKMMDFLPVSEGGGGGFQDKWFAVMGCWLNLLRGWTNAIQTLNDPDQAPYYALAAKNLSLGIEPEGASYDFDIARRTLVSLMYVYHRKGTCPGIIEAVRMFTLWDAKCVAFGHGEGGPSPFKVWNGTSGAATYTGTPPTVTCTNRLLVDSSQSWDVGLWQEGTVIGPTGDIALVTGNTATELSLLATTAVTYTTADIAVGDLVFFVESVVGLRAHMTVQLEDAVDPSVAEVVEVYRIITNARLIVLISRTAPNAYTTGAKVSIGKSLVRSEYLGPEVGTSVLGQDLIDTKASWPINCWTGYKLLDQSNVLHDVVSNTADTVTVDGAPPDPGQYAIAFDFTVGATFADRVPTLRYKVTNGEHYRLFEPTLDIEVRGTFYDPFSYLWQGPGSTILGAWGSMDLGIYVLTTVAMTIGKAASALLNVLTVDPTVPALGSNDLVGMYLNPNQNQERLFRIVANDASTITVDQSIASLVVPGQVYYVLKARDASRFKRINARLREEFSHPDITPHVLFM
jgi:hypothetical protein